MNSSKIKSKNWQKVKLGEIAEVEYGKDLSTRELKQSGFPVYGGNGIIGYSDKYLYKEPKIIIGCRGAYSGNVFMTKPKSFVTHNSLVLNLKEKSISERFIFYKLLVANVKSTITGSAQPQITIKELERLEIEIPEDINEQRRIAEILSAFDEKIEVNNKINKTLEEMANAIFKEWFVNNEKLKVKSEKLVKIKEMVDIISGYSFSSKLYNREKRGLGVVTIKNVQDGNFITNCDSSIKEEKIPKNMNPECRIKDGDILLSLTGNVGRICFVYGGEYLLNQRVAKLKPKNKNYISFVYFLFRQPEIQNLLIAMAKGSAQPNLSPVETGEIEISIPSENLIEKFSEKMGPIYNQLIKNKVENQKLTALRDLLLPKLMSGEIRI